MLLGCCSTFTDSIIHEIKYLFKISKILLVPEFMTRLGIYCRCQATQLELCGKVLQLYFRYRPKYSPNVIATPRINLPKRAVQGPAKFARSRNHCTSHYFVS